MTGNTIVDKAPAVELKGFESANALRRLKGLVTNVELRTYPHAARYAYTIQSKRFYFDKPIGELTNADALKFLRACGAV